MRGQGQSRARASRPPARPHPPRPPRRGEQARLSLPPRPPQKESHSRDTHATVAGTQGGHRVEGNDTAARPQAPEGRPGALQGHHRGSHEARSHTRVGRAARRRRHSPPRHREGRSPGTRREGEAGAICCVRRPTAPTDAPRQGTAGDRRSGPEATHPTPAFLTLPDGQRGGKTSEGPPRTDREERTRSLGTPVPRLARLRLGPGEHDHTTSIRGAKVGRGEARRGQSPEGPALSLAGNLHPPHLASGESGQRPQEENT